MTDDELLALYRDRYPNISVETARALQRMSGYGEKLRSPKLVRI